MARLSHIVFLSAVLGLASTEPDYCKRGVAIAQSYQHCFVEAHYLHPYRPLRQPHEFIDGCMVEAYANHTCRVVKPAALSCFLANITDCDYKERLFAIADESGGACYGDHINREFKEHVLNFLEPVRGDSECFLIADRTYECYSHAGYEMAMNNPNLRLLSVEEFVPVANHFFDSIYNCFVAVYRSNKPLCEHWQIPLLLDLQDTALPSLFGMTFTADQMDRLELTRGCPVHHLQGVRRPVWRRCYDEHGSENNNDDDNNRPSDTSHHVAETDKQLQEENTPPPFVDELLQQHEEDDELPPIIQKLKKGA